MKQIFKLVNLFLVILLVSFTSCTNDLSEKDSQMSFSFTLPQEKLNRTTDDNNDKTLWNVTAVIENKKDIIQKIEQSGYSGETVTITFNEILVGQKVRINIDLTQDGETTPSYTGSSDWFIVKKDENKINIKLSKVEIILPVDAALPKINTSPESIVEIATSGSTETIAKTLSVNATSTDSGTLSFIWQEKNENNEWTSYTPITTTTDNNTTTCSIGVTVNKGQVRTFRCIITNTNNSVNGNKTATIETDEVTVAYVEGTLTSITAQYTGQFETFGSRPYSSVKVTEIYTSGSKTTDVTVTAYDSRYTIEPKNDTEKAIGYVPYTIKYNFNANVTTEIRVPVKYQLSAGDFVITSTTNEIGNSTSSNPEKIAQFIGNTTLQVKTSATSNIPNEIYKDENSARAEDYDILENLQSVWKKTINNLTTEITNTKADNSIEGTYIYTNTLTVPTDNSWCVRGSIELEYYVKVCPWTLAVNNEDGNSVNLDNLTENTTYKLSATNEALEATTTTYITWESDKNSFVVENDNLTTPQASTSDQTATITAKVDNNKEVGSVKVTVKKVEPLGSQANPFTLWSDLKSYLENNSSDETEIYVKDNLTANSKITVGKPIKIIPVGEVTITRSSTFADEFFLTNDSFEIAGTQTAKITFNGESSTNAQQPIIKATASLKLSYCDFNNNVNTSTDGGAIYVNKNDTSTINVNLSNCNFNNNFVTNTVNGGAVALYGKSIISQINNCTFTNNKATNGGGGAIYLETNGTSPTNNINTITNCTFTNNTSSSNGSAIYLKKGHIILEGTTISNNLYLDSVQYTYCTFKGNNNLHCVDFKVSYGGAFSEITIDDTFDTSSVISINIVNKENISSSNPLKFININIENDIINCFKITDEEGTSWILNSDGTITTATSGGSSGGTSLSGTTVTSETQLLDALSGTAEIIIIENDITLTGSNYLVIENKTVQIAANTNVTITQTTGANYLIWVKSGGNLTLGGGEGMLTLQGNSSATEELIYMKGNKLTLTENCKLTGVSNTYAKNAINIINGEFNMTGGEITGNTAGSAITTDSYQTGNITMNISGGKIYKNSGATNGGAINIVNPDNTSFTTTVNIYGTAEIYNNTANNYGGSIYMTGSNNILNVNPSTESDKVKIYDNYQTTTNQNASIYIDDGTFNLNGNNLTRNLTPYSSNINKP